MKVVPLPKGFLETAKNLGIDRLRVKIEPHYQTARPEAEVWIYPESLQTGDFFHAFERWAVDSYIGMGSETNWDCFFPEGIPFCKMNMLEENEKGEKILFGSGLSVPFGISIFYDVKNETVRVNRWTCVRQNLDDTISQMEISER